MVFPRYFLLAMAAIALAATVPAWYLLIERWPTWYDHNLRAILLTEYSYQFWKGDFYPYWLERANSGLGSPVAIFQPPLPNLLGALLAPLQTFDPHGYGRLLLLMAFFIFIGGAGAYQWLSGHFEPWQAKQGALLYGCFFSYGGLLTGNLPSLLFFALMPWCFAIAHKLSKDPLHYGPYYALCQAALCMTHLISTLIFSPVLVMYALLCASHEQRVKVGLSIAAAATIGLMLAAIYWVICVSNMEFILHGIFTRGLNHYWVQFPRILKYPTDWASFFFFRHAVLLLMTLPLAVSYFIVAKNKPFAEHRQLHIFFLAVYLVAIFMFLPLSKPIWDHVKFIHKFQFSGRFLVVCTSALVFILTCLLPKLRHFAHFYVCIIALAAFSFIFNANYNYSAAQPPVWQNTFRYIYIPQEPHMTVWMRKAGMKSAQSLPPKYLDMPQWRIENGEAVVSTVEYDTRRIALEVEVASPSAMILLKRFYYPGWQLGSGSDQDIKIVEREALLAVDVPQGHHVIQLDQPWLPGEKLAKTLSALGALLWGAWVVLARKKLREKA